MAGKMQIFIKSNQKYNKNLKKWYAVSIALQLGFLIAVQIGGFMALGYYIDKRFRTSPLGVIIGMFIGLAMAAYESYRLLLPLLRRDK